jgi:RpiB/LacA/LacB family sugar-phosphate isomerase
MSAQARFFLRKHRETRISALLGKGGYQVRVAIASDNAGQEVKKQLTAKLMAGGHVIFDAAPPVQEPSQTDYAEQVALSVFRRHAERGIVVTSRGVGASLAANRVPGIRAAMCNDAHSAQLCAENEGMNVVVLPLHAMKGDLAQEIAVAYLGATLAPVEVLGGLPPRRLQRVLSHIRENLCRDVSVAELAELVSMSQCYFAKLFKMSTGTTPHQYIMRQRVQHAQEVLCETQTPLAEVASAAGFQTQSYFTSVFRRQVGATPKTYRETHRAATQVPDWEEQGQEVEREATTAAFTTGRGAVSRLQVRCASPMCGG